MKEISSDDPFYQGIEYLPGDIAVVGGEEYRIASTSRFKDHGLESVQLPEYVLRERRALAHLRSRFGAARMDRVLSSLSGKKGPRFSFQGRKVGSGRVAIQNPLIRYVQLLLDSSTPSENIRDWNLPDECTSLFGVFQRLLSIGRKDNCFVEKTWQRFWAKSDALPYCEESLTYYQLIAAGLSVHSLEETKRDTPDFVIFNPEAHSRFHLETKTIRKNDGDGSDMMAQLHQHVLRLADAHGVRISMGFRANGVPPKSSLAVYQDMIESIVQELATSTQADPINLKAHGLEIVGIRIPNDAKADLPPGYALKIQFPLVQHGFDMERHLFAGYTTITAEGEVEAATQTFFHFPTPRWVSDSIERVLSKALRQVSSFGSGIIHLKFPYSGNDEPERLHQIREALDLVENWSKSHRSSNLLGTIASFQSRAIHPKLAEEKRVEAFRMVERNVKFINPSSILTNQSEELLFGLALAFPQIRVRLYPFQTYEERHLKRVLPMDSGDGSGRVVQCVW